MRCVPPVDRSRPAMRLSSVDFPEPDVPTRAMNSPAFTVRETPSSARTVESPMR